MNVYAMCYLLISIHKTNALPDFVLLVLITCERVNSTPISLKGMFLILLLYCRLVGYLTANNIEPHRDVHVPLGRVYSHTSCFHCRRQQVGY